jgi:hypothetical protein
MTGAYPEYGAEATIGRSKPPLLERLLSPIDHRSVRNRPRSDESILGRTSMTLGIERVRRAMSQTFTQHRKDNLPTSKA